MSDSATRVRSGLVYGLIAYGWWGLVPLYFAALKRAGVPAWEVLAHRIAWALPLLLVLTAIAGGWGDIARVFRSRRLAGTMLLSAVLLAINWFFYIYATDTGRVTEASLGYFMLPLVNAALATAVLGEKLRPAHYPALVLVAAAVVVPSVGGGFFPWLAVSVAVSFGLYGLVRKRVPVESLPGLTVESLLLLPPSLAYLAFLSAGGRNHFGPDWSLNALIAFSCVVTVVPLLTFTLSLRRLPLLAVSFLQFVSPTIQMVIAIVVLGETMTDEKAAAFACVWAAVLIFVGDAIWQARQKRKAPGRPSVGIDRVVPRVVTR